MDATNDHLMLVESGSGIDSVIEEHISNDWEDLNHQLKGFALAYVQHYNHRLAAQQVSLDKGQGVSLLKNPLVSAYIKHLVEEKRIRLNVTDDMVTTMWINLLPKLMGDEEVDMVDNVGTSFRAKKFHASESVRALTEISKATKFYEEGSGQGVNINIHNTLIKTDMSAAEASTAYRDVISEQ